MLSKRPGGAQQGGVGGGGVVGQSPSTPTFSQKTTSLLPDSNVIIPNGEKLLPSLLQQIAKASTPLPIHTWTVPSCSSAFTPHSEQTMTTAAQSPKPSVSLCKLDPSNIATHVLEQQLASHILERYSAQLSPSQHFSSPLSSKLFGSPNTLGHQLSSSTALLSNQLTTTNSLLGNHLCSSHFLSGGSGGSGTTGLSQQQHQLGANSGQLILPRFNSTLSPSGSPRVKDHIIKSDENNSRRLRWKEEHGRVLISIWKEKYPQVRAAKKIKEKHAIWQEIGEDYNKFCVKYDWPARSTEQVKIKVKNCIDEYKQTIKYNQEYKTCPYFKDIDDIFGMSDPEKAAELQKSVNISPVQSCNSENAYWSGTSLPTQVKKRKLNISCNMEKDEPERKSPKSAHNSPLKGEDTQSNSSSSYINVSLAQTPQTTPAVLPIVPETPFTSATSSAAPKLELEEPRYDVKIGTCNMSTKPGNSQTPLSISQFGDLIKQLHEREDKVIEMYHRMDLERRNAILVRERERYEAEFQLEKSRQVFLSNVIEKLINVVQDKNLVSESETSKLFPKLEREPEVMTKTSDD